MAQTDTQNVSVLANGAKLFGETVIPGASLLMDGQFCNGIIHTAVGVGARLALGPIGLVLVCADSFSKSTTDKTLWDHVNSAYKARAEKKAAKEAAAKDTVVVEEVVATAA